MILRGQKEVSAKKAGTPASRIRIRPIITAVDKLSLAAAVISSALLVGIALLMASEIACRKILGTSLLVTWEYSSYMMAAVFFLGSPYALRSGTHVRVDLLQAALPTRKRQLLNRLALACGMLLAGFIAFALADFAVNSYSRSLTSFTPARTPLFFPQAVITLGAILLCMQMGAEFLRSFSDQGTETQANSELPT